MLPEFVVKYLDYKKVEHRLNAGPSSLNISMVDKHYIANFDVRGLVPHVREIY